MSYQPPNETISNPLTASTSLDSSHRVTTPLIVTDLAALRGLSESRSFRSKEPIIIRLPDLSLEQAEALSSRINGYRNECGCSLGAKTMAAGFSIMLVLLLVSYGVFTGGFLLRLPFPFLFAFLCAGAGKAIGIHRARRRLRLELDQICAGSQSAC